MNPDDHMAAASDHRRNPRRCAGDTISQQNVTLLDRDPTTGLAAANIGQPQGSMLFYSIYLFQQGFESFRMGYASAMAWVLFAITMICTVAIIKGSRRWVHYQGGGGFR